MAVSVRQWARGLTLDWTYLWNGMLFLVRPIIDFIFIVTVAAGVGFVAGIGLGYVVTLPCRTDIRERLPTVFGVIGGIA